MRTAFTRPCSTSTLTRSRRCAASIWRVFYGDATRLDLMRTAGAATAKVLVLAIDDVEQSVEVAKMVRENFPDLTIVARARNVQHYFELLDLGVTMIERETFDAALMSARSVLEALGWERHQARTLALRFRRHNIDVLLKMAPHHKDEAKVVAAAKQGRLMTLIIAARYSAELCRSALMPVVGIWTALHAAAVKPWRKRLDLGGTKRMSFRAGDADANSA